MTVSIKGLEAVLMPLMDSMAPPVIKEPQCKLCKLIKQLVEEQLGVNMQSELILRFIIDACEKDPAAMETKLIELLGSLEKMLFEAGALKK